MWKRLVGGVVAALVGSIVFSESILKRSASQHFDNIFCGFPGQTVCFDRKDFREDLENLISRPNPSGIIFICGRINAGKTTTVSAALKNRKHIAYINWREKRVTSASELNDNLKDAFKIKNFKDYWNFRVKFLPGWLLGRILWLVPHLDFEDTEMKELSKTQKEIEKVLTFAGKRISDRPVIFIDEIGALHGLIDSGQGSVVEGFMAWFVKISKDYKLCDIIFASNDGFAMDMIRTVDPQYCSSIIIPDFSLEDEDKKELMKEIKLYRARNRENTVVDIPPDILDIVGGHAGHFLPLCQVDSSLQVEKKFRNLKEGEKAKLQSALDDASPSCKKWFQTRDLTCGCYEKKEFKKVMDVFLSPNSDDLDIPWDTLVRESGVHQEIVKLFVKRNYLFYNPDQHTLKARTKLFLHVYKQYSDRDAEKQALEKSASRHLSILENSETSYSERDEAKLTLLNIEKDLRALEALEMGSTIPGKVLPFPRGSENRL